MKNKILKVNNLNVKYGKYTILDSINFSIESGDYVGIVGPNGAGKTTLIKSILGLIPIESGDIINYLAKGATDIGYLAQRTETNHKIFPATVEEVITTGVLSSKTFPKILNKQDRESVDLIINKLNLTELKNKRVGSLSGGEQQRVFLARALVNNPKLLILDEPTTALDPKVREEFYSLLSKLNKEDGITILFISHDIGTIGKYSSKMLYLDKTLIFYGSYKEFCESKNMTDYFGFISQHQFCWRHKDGKNNN